MSDSARDTGRIVVGVDGSDASKAALLWAVAQGAASGASVEAVAAWEAPVDWYGLVPQSDDKTVAAEGVAERLEGIVAETVGTPPPVEIRTTVTEGNPASVLVDAAQEARLLVVGNRGHGRFSEAFLGSVSLRCAQHATVPVVIVRAPG
ncbi:universal stress protein [Streptomyces sp. SID14446]|uniref:universal stress protein n=1 Tax=unclassified Streptomyces TaxID=2593676 RepID=UPI0013B7649D|nr:MULTISPECIES: universal stress protein [unclassified Streptomyces]MCX4913134.1 universal stress protein [Streptomyces sp. NBC_00687]NEB33760.1 universal stress protein [Streptomyces sp. SID14446]